MRVQHCCVVQRAASRMDLMVWISCDLVAICRLVRVLVQLNLPRAKMQCEQEIYSSGEICLTTKAKIRGIAHFPM